MNNTTINLVKQLIAIPSTADNRVALGDALEVIADYLANHKAITVERFESNGKPSLLAYRGSDRPEKFRVLLNGHVDVVPGREAQFTPEENDDRLYGRGALDMKAAAVVLTQVFCELADTVPYPLGLQIVTDEEIGGKNGTLHQLEQGVKTDFVIAGEFTPRAEICNESRGICWAEMEFTGTAAHSAYLWNGNNAILLAQDFIAKLLAEIPVPAESVWATTANVATISSDNTTFNRVPDTAKVGIDIRFVAADERFASTKAAAVFLQSLAPEATVNIIQVEPSHFADPNDPNLKKLAATVEETTRQPAKFIQKHGAADIRFFSDRGIPAVVLGLQGEGLHSDVEYVELESLPRYAETLRAFLADL